MNVDETLEQIQASVAAIAAELQALNGSVGQHQLELHDINNDLYGNTGRGLTGVKQNVNEIHELVVGLKAQGKLISWFLGLLLSGGILNLIILLNHLKDLSGP